MNSDVAIRKRLRSWRRLQKLTQEQLGIEVGTKTRGKAIPSSTIASYENRDGPSQNFLMDLKAAYPDFSLDWLFGGEENEPEDLGAIHRLISAEMEPSLRNTIVQMVAMPFKNSRRFPSLQQVQDSKLENLIKAVELGLGYVFLPSDGSQ